MVTGQGGDRPPTSSPRDRLTTANSLNVAAAYGTFPLAAGTAALLAKLAEKLPAEGWVDTWRLNEEGLAFYVDGLTFLMTAFIIWRIAIPTRSREERRSGQRGSWDLGGAIRELREGWEFIAVKPDRAGGERRSGHWGDGRRDAGPARGDLRRRGHRRT